MTRIGKFEVVRRLGRGGMGAVYEGYDRSLDRRVAVKTLTTEIVSDHDVRRRFEREARAAAKLQHPNIITIYELGNFGVEEKPYIVMEYLGGTDLSEIISWQSEVPFAAAMEIAAQLCRGLDFAHLHQVVHRDVKPSNIRYLDDGQIKIMDFGIARVAGAAQITESDVVVGTPHYMSPERIMGDPIDGRADIFSVGCILYEMLTGERPFQADSATGVLYRIVNEPPPRILDKNPDLPEQTEDILSRALAAKPSERFDTSGEMAQLLESLLRFYCMGFPRPNEDIRNRLREIESLRSKQRWAELIPRAEKLLRDRPDLTAPWLALCRAVREHRCEEEEKRFTVEEKALHMAEVAQEVELLQPTMMLDTEPQVSDAPPGATAGDLNIDGLTGGLTNVLPQKRPFRLSAVAAILLALVMVALLGGVFLRGLWVPGPISQAVRVSSDPPGSRIFVNGEEQAVITDAEGPVALWVEGLPGETVSIELRKAGYESAHAVFTLGSESPPSLDMSLPPILRKVEVRTDPPGASLSLDGEELGATTPLEVALSSVEEHELVISKGGYARRRLTIPPGGDLPEHPIVLSEAGAGGTSNEGVEPGTPESLGTLAVRSDYPLSIREGRLSLAGPSLNHSIRLSAGRHQIVFYAPSVFLNRTYEVDVSEGETLSLRAPELGRASIRAFPENAGLSINGIAAGDLPINDMPIVAGTHTFVFDWPNADRDRQRVVVKAGERVYVTGQKRP